MSPARPGVAVWGKKAVELDKEVAEYCTRNLRTLETDGYKGKINLGWTYVNGDVTRYFMERGRVIEKSDAGPRLLARFGRKTKTKPVSAGDVPFGDYDRSELYDAAYNVARALKKANLVPRAETDYVKRLQLVRDLMKGKH